MQQAQTNIETLFRKYHQQLYRLASVCLHNEEEGKDVVSDVFARLVQRGRQSDAPITEGYLRTAVRNRCMDIVAHQQVRQRVERLLPVDGIVSLPENHEEQRYLELRRFVDEELPEQSRQVFKMRYDERKTYREIADSLSVSEKTVYKHLHDAITRLHEHFKNRDYGEV